MARLPQSPHDGGGRGRAAAWMTPSLYPAPLGCHPVFSSGSLPISPPGSPPRPAPRASACGILSLHLEGQSPLPVTCRILQNRVHAPLPAGWVFGWPEVPLRWAGSTPPPCEDRGTFCVWRNQCGSACPSVRVALQHRPSCHQGHQGTCRPQSPRRQLGKLVPFGTERGPGLHIYSTLRRAARAAGKACA